jgi:NADH dehydrogenase
MIIKKICVLGGSGFVGRHVCAALAARGYRLVVPTRNAEQAKTLTTLPTVEPVNANIHDPEQLGQLLQGCDAVINLVGVLHEGRALASFSAAHVDLAKTLIEACRQQGVQRVLQMSALHVGLDAPSQYLRSKAQAEGLLRQSGLALTIFRPSVIFGEDDHFLNLFANMLKGLPVVIVPGGYARFQPVYVGDVARVIAEAVSRNDSVGCTYDLGGPKTYTLKGLVDLVAQTLGLAHKRWVFAADQTLTWLMAFMMEILPGQLMSLDNVRSMQKDSVIEGVGHLPFGFLAQSVEALLPTWLAQQNPRGRYARFRDRATR